jgi:hypothetical protein
MRQRSPWRSSVLLVLSIWLIGPGALPAAEPVALRVDSLVVAPSHTPPLVVWIKNLGRDRYQGKVAVKLPDGWVLKPDRLEVSLDPGEAKALAFMVARGSLNEANRYPIEVSAVGTGATVVRRQEIACSSAPYFNPTIDGDPADWKDAIPVTFTTGGKKTVISTFWNRRSFAMLVAVEEDKLLAYREDGPLDAVQVAISPQGSTTGTSPDGQSTRHEFLLAAASEGTKGKCFRLAEPGNKLAQGQEERALGPLAYREAAVAVSRQGGVTYYECSIPFKLLRKEIPPGEGREFCLSVLVHDPNGTGIRDWGQAAGLWESQRNRLAWSRWKGARWGDKPPWDNKTAWGLCSSKY